MVVDDSRWKFEDNHSTITDYHAPFDRGLKLLFSGFLPLKGDFVCGQDDLKYREINALLY